MQQALKDAITICKTFLRNGYDAHVINAPLQEHLLQKVNHLAVDIACEPDMDTLFKLFPKATATSENRALAVMEENGVTYRFYPLEAVSYTHLIKCQCPNSTAAVRFFVRRHLLEQPELYLRQKKAYTQMIHFGHRSRYRLP